MLQLESGTDNTLYVSQIAEDFRDLAQFFGADTEAIINYAQRHFKSSHRQLEWLTIRAMLRSIGGKDVDIAYHANGKPSLINSSQYISISHTRRHAVILLSNNPTVGVDIEQTNSKILSLSNRIANASEMPEDFDKYSEEKQRIYLTTLWTIKEAVYKSLNEQHNIHILEDIIAQPFDIYSLPTITKAGVKKRNHSFCLFSQAFENNIISTVIS